MNYINNYTAPVSDMNFAFLPQPVAKTIEKTILLFLNLCY